MHALLLENPTTAYRILVPLVSVLVVGGMVLGVFVDDNATEIVSGGILLITSVICRRILDLRRAPGTSMFRGSARIWALISLGFMFLVFDEALSIHEGTDLFIHWIFSLDETGLSDRIDDFIVLFYGIIGIILIYFHRSEFLNLTEFYKYLIVGAVLLCLMVFLDAFGNRSDVVDYLGMEGTLRNFVMKFVSIGEELSKLLSEAIFLFGFMRIFQKFYDQR